MLRLSPWHGVGGKVWLGAALGAGSAVFDASNVLVNKRLAPTLSASELMFYHGLVATPVLAAFVPRAAWSSNVVATAIVAAGSVGPGALGGLAFTWSLRRVHASHASTLTLLEPLVALMLAVVVYGEHHAWPAGLGALLILAGAAVVVTARK